MTDWDSFVEHTLDHDAFGIPLGACAARPCPNETTLTWCPTHQPRDHEDDRKPRSER